MRKLLSSILTVAVLLGTSGCQAQDETKPWITVSFSGYDELLTDLGMIGELGGNANFRQQLDMMSMMLPRGEGAEGPLAVDPQQPWGAVLMGDDQTSISYAFLPISDINPLVQLAEAQSQKKIKATGGVYEFPSGPKTVYATQKGEWIFVADSVKQLDDVTTDPIPLLGDLPKRYNLAVRASIKNLPQAFREQLLAQLRAGAEVGLQQMPGENDDQYAMRLNIAKQGIEQLTALVNEMDELLLGWNVDAKTKTTYLDLELTAQPGTKLASQFAEIKPGVTDFAGLLLPDAAVTVSSVGTMSDAQVTQALGGLGALRKSAVTGLDNQGLTEDEVKLASRLLNNMIDVMEKTIEARKTDLAASLVLTPAAVTFIGGVAIADGAKLDETVGQLIEEVKKSEEAAQALKLSDETVEGIHLSVISMPTPDPQLMPLVGDTLEMVVGITDDKLLLAFGRDAVKTLKKSIGQINSDAKEVPPLQITVAVAPLAKFIAEVGDDPQTKATASMLAGMLAQAGDQGHVTLTAQPISQGVRVRLELEEGLLKTIGAMTQMMGAMAPGGGF